MDSQTVLLIVVLGVTVLVGGFFLGFVLRKRWVTRESRSAESRAKAIIEEAEGRAKTIQKEAELSARDHLFKMKTETEEEERKRRQELSQIERRILTKEENLDRKIETLEKREAEAKRFEQSLEQKKKNLEELERKYQGLMEESRQTLEKLSGTTAEEAKRMLIEKMASEATHEAAKKIKQIEDEAKETADKKAKKIIALAVERMAGEWVQEASVSVVKLPSEDMKGRVIGREGRNIRTLEQLTGVDLIVDDTPGAVVLSSHNPIRREIARVTLERLLVDGRIHPARIEEILEKVTQEVDKGIREAGQQALFELDIHGLHPELIKLLGALRYRYSYAQNVLRHSIEVGFMCGIMAVELGLDQKVARRAGLLHDIGKAVSHEIEGSHAVIGGELARKYGEAAPVVHAVWAHHEDIPQESVLDHLVDAADALSGARPGARMESAETYIKRLEDLERIATSYNQVEKAYAIQAGRELRVLVQPEKLSDADAVLLCKDITKKIESELTYPGQIKVTVIRETRAVDFAK
jgi:ribonuclease Y